MARQKYYIPGEAIGGSALEMLRHSGPLFSEGQREELRSIVLARSFAFLGHYSAGVAESDNAVPCQEMLEMFQPGKGESWVAEIAKRACAVCVARVDCQTTAVQDKGPHIRAGMTSRERKRLRGAA